MRRVTDTMERLASRAVADGPAPAAPKPRSPRRAPSYYVWRAAHRLAEWVLSDTIKHLHGRIDEAMALSQNLEFGQAGLQARITVGLAGSGRAEEAQLPALAELTRQRAVLEDLAREIGTRLPSEEELRDTADALDPASDAFYADFEAAFRAAEEVTVWQREYVQDVRASASADHPVLDLGSGRGEWLDVLREQGIAAYGVETNGLFLESCAARGLDVRKEDALEHLRGVAAESLGAVTAFHLVEHLDLSQLLALLDASMRALRRGGILILESPNPINLIVGATTFWLDPTHARPVHPLFIEFALRRAGFADVEIRLLHPSPETFETPSALVGDESGQRFVAHLDGLIFGARDYAALGRVPLEA